jgi:ATP-dependent Clp protease, protease subunit
MKPQENDHDQEPQFSPFDQFCFESYQALLKDRTILLNSDIKPDVIERVCLPMLTLSEKSNKPIKLLIHSSGGDIEAGQAVVDSILTSKAPIITVAFGKAMSAAFDIFLAGQFRIVYPNTVLMCHSGSAKLEVQTLPAINAEAQLHEVLFDRWAKFYAARTKISEKEWHTLLSTGLNKYWFPEQAVIDGLVHSIVKIPKKNLKSLSKYKW